MIDQLEFSFIYSKDAVKVKAFVGEIPRSIECINYMDIYNKLSKNDYLQSEPSDAVVSSYLMRQLQASLSKSTTYSIYYVLSDLSKDTVDGIKYYVESLTKRKIHYKIYHTPDVDVKASIFSFNEIVEFEVDL
jgi:hypothetical protein